MQACPKCGHGIEGRPNFCPACGASFTVQSQTDDDPLIGRMIDGSYKIEKMVGEGAMGRVYQANHQQLRKKVALKILRSNLVADDTVVARFEREALAASRLDHANCISIFGYGSEDDGELLWMAMEFIQGRDLGTIIAEDSPIETRRVVHIIGQVCEALDEAHSANIIHRDLKPANIVCYDHRRTPDFVKVLDFGIAKITDPGEDYVPLTRDGIVCGTPAYMSPEQVQGFELDNRSDLFSLGIILYQTLTGILPFFAESAVEVATKIVIEEPAPPSKAKPDWSYPPELEAVVLRLLSKKKEERYSNAIEVKEALQACLATLKARNDASLDLPPDQLAELMADADEQVEGAATLQLSTDMIARAMAADALKSDAGSKTVEQPRPPSAEREAARQVAAQAPPLARSAPPGPSTPPNVDALSASDIMSRPSSALRRPAASQRSNTGMLVGLGVFLALAGVGAWWFLFRT